MPNPDPACPHDRIVTHNDCLECGDCGRVLGPAPDAPGLTAAELAAMAARFELPMRYDLETHQWVRPSAAETQQTVHRLLAEVARLRALVGEPL